MSINNNQPQRNLFGDPSLWFLLLSNLATIFFATTENWNLSTIMWVYWFQSITIGFFNFIRILQLKEFSTEGFKINGQPAQSTQGTKFFTAFFFLFHYGFFHFIYLIFLLTGTFTKAYGNVPDFIELKYIFLTALLFFVNHLFSYFYNRPRDTKKQNIGSLMFYPYARIIPMHLTIIFGSAFVGALPFFLVLKTFADGIMHIVEHNVLRKGELQ
ncbi:hypothetical protein KKC67_00480 [Patescibacteria group bacterium]|nr:hypothetical protein [Patescibacteria group bacterium]MBU1783372.1 hypothetical protein [Patescibacteria group bacterium]MBU1991473.1 hypothetical protein [Patescibacteria group bacterium]MBU2081168.1 hypothetical protein [Patescibacteria group bacterium]